jgi:hypothetical protein
LWEPFETRDLQRFREKNPVRGQRFKSSLPDHSSAFVFCDSREKIPDTISIEYPPFAENAKDAPPAVTILHV